MCSRRIKSLIVVCATTALMFVGTVRAARAETGPGARKGDIDALRMMRGEVALHLSWSSSFPNGIETLDAAIPGAISAKGRSADARSWLAVSSPQARDSASPQDPAAARGSSVSGVSTPQPRRPRPGRGLILAGKWMIGVGTPLAVIGAVLVPIGCVASGIAGDGMFWSGVAMVTVGGVAAITGIVLWSVGAKRNRLAQSWRQVPFDPAASRLAARRVRRLPQVWSVAACTFHL